MIPLTESQFQKRVIAACLKEEGCHAIRIARMWAVMGGIPDLYIKHPSYPAVWLELKVNHKTGLNLDVPLSPLQRHFIRREKGAGGHAGWAMLQQTSQTWALYIGNRSETMAVPNKINKFSSLGKRVEINILQILEAIVNG